MKSILILSSIYPGPDIPIESTPVVHYFVREWKKMGYNVRVIANETYFWSPLYWTPLCVKNYIARHSSVIIPLKRLNKMLTYELDGIKVSRIPIFKLLPMRGFSKKKLEKQVSEILKILEHEEFYPDIIIGHWANPQLYLVAKLSETYNCKTALVLHENGEIIKRIPDYKNLLFKINCWGYRSEQIKINFSKLYSIPTTFRCYSGIPEYYLQNLPQRNWKHIKNFCYVGQLIQRKFPDVVIQTLKSLYNDNEFEFNIIGSGPMESSLIRQSESDNRIKLRGRLDRKSIIEILDKSDIFVMISKDEVFGLVYLEAMARGCIVIAAEGEGMDGIIKSGANGFLCKAGSEEDLTKIINQINRLSPEELSEISNNAISTASSFTDSKVALSYINSVI